jgi:hypothetical protein
MLNRMVSCVGCRVSGFGFQMKNYTWRRVKKIPGARRDGESKEQRAKSRSENPSRFALSPLPVSTLERDGRAR